MTGKKLSGKPGTSPKRAKKPSKTAPKVLEPEILPEEESDAPAESPEPDEADWAAEADAAPAPSLPATRGAAPTDLTEPEVTAVSTTDPLRRYLEEIRRHPLLDPETEFNLAVKLRDTGDLDAAKRLVQANLRLVVKIALEYRSFYTNLLDLVQEGNIGLMKAVSKFDPTKGARLGYYSSWWIRSYILKYLLDNFRLVKIGTTQAQKKLFYHLLREKERLEAQGLLAGPKLLASRLDVREKDVIEMEQRLSSRGAEVPIDAPTHPDGEGMPLSATLPDSTESVDETLARQEWLEVLREHLPAFQKLLDPKELQLLKERLLADEPKTLQEVADHYGLTRERARQIEAKVIQKLREFLKDYLSQD